MLGQDKGVPELAEFYSESSYWELPIKKNPINDSRNLVRFNALVSFVGRGYYFVHTVIFCFLSTTASILFLHGIKLFVKILTNRLIVLLFFVPSVLFWTSGVMKEAVMIFGLGMFLFGLLHFVKKQFNWKTILSFILGLLVMSMFKPYVLYTLVLPFIAFVICLIKPSFSKIKVYGTSVFVLFLVFLLWNKPVDVLTFKQKDFINISKGEIILEGDSSYIYIDEKYRDLIVFGNNSATFKENIPAIERIYYQKEKNVRILNPEVKDLEITWCAKQSGSYFEMTEIEGDKWTMFKNLPFAINNVIFRPFPWDENMDIYKVLAIIENVFAFLFILWAWRSRVRYQERAIKNIISFMLFWVTLLYALIGQVTPVSGAIMRYKVPGLFLLAGVVVLLLFGYDKKHELQKLKDAKSNEQNV